MAKSLYYRDIRLTMRDMLEYHIEYKEMSPLLVKRSFKLYVEQFDPNKTYLLKSEALPYLELTTKRVSQVLNGFAKDDYKEYTDVAMTMSEAVNRARLMRAEVIQEMLAGTPITKTSSTSFVDFAKTPKELKARIAASIHRYLRLDERPLDGEKLQKSLALIDKKLTRREKPYFLSSQQDTEKSVVEHTLKALARSLDAHTAYFTPDEAYDIRTSLKKQLEGIGIILREGINGVYIADLIENGPAYQSGGVKIGDVVVQVNGKIVENLTFEEVLEELKGSAGSQVELVIKRDQVQYTVRLVREQIAMSDELVRATSVPYADGIIGMIDLPGFYDNGKEINAEKHLREALIKLKNEGELRGLVIDMRENAGGFLTQAVKIAGMFISRGVIVISKYHQGEVQYLRNLDGRIFFDGPVVLLTSKASASAAEIVAGALQDYGVALVVGDTRTYGKGTMQYQNITDGKADKFFKVTVGRYYTVSGKSTQIIGVPADIHVPTIYSPFNIGERYLEYPISSDQLAAAYLDPLTGVDPKTEQVLKEKYIPYLQKQKKQWQKMIPTLQANSAYRLQKDPNFQCFVQVINGKSPACTRKNNFGADDLQMREALNIVRDMIALAQ
ncbi:MAG: PDZ domain-containing protein [Chlamydiales bacterium]|nr:PDZ domain-containing protein [Chlamydiales bacterium]